MTRRSRQNPWPSDLTSYAGIADELSDPRMTLDDLDPRAVQAAREAADTHRLPWPPLLTWEDDVRDAQTRADRAARRAAEDAL